MHCKLCNGRSYSDRLVTVNVCRPFRLCIWVCNFQWYIASGEPVHIFIVYPKLRKSDYVTLGPVVVNLCCSMGLL